MGPVALREQRTVPAGTCPAKLFMVQGVNTIVGAAPALDLDAQLMLRVKDGDEHSFGVLLEKHRNPVIHFVFRMVQDRAVAENAHFHSHFGHFFNPLRKLGVKSINP